MEESRFKKPEFLSGSNIYEVNVRQYTPEGTFNAFAAHLPRLKDMGVEILWFMPIHPIGVIKRKGTLGSYYSISNHEAVNPEFGTAEDFKNLVSKIHDAGMKIIIDWVANHAAWDHVWTISNPDFFTKDAAENFKPPYDWDDVIQIDHTNKDEQGAMVNAMQFWITEFNIDGFRADLAHLTPLQFWKDARVQLTPVKKDLIWLAETEEPSYHEAFDISYTWKWMHETEKLTKKESSLSNCMDVLKGYKNEFSVAAERLFFTSNHDENSWNGTEYEKYGHLAKALAVFSCTYRGIPLIYSGQEMPNKKRLKFFEKDLIGFSVNNELHDFYKTLLGLRKKNGGCQVNSEYVFISEEYIDRNILAFRPNGEYGIAVFINLGSEDFVGNISMKNLTGSYKDIFTEKVIEIAGEYQFRAKPGEYTVIEKLK